MIEKEYFNLGDKLGWNIPKVCPVCGEKIEINSSGFVLCKNKNCGQKKVHGINRAFRILNIKGGGDVFVQNLINKDFDFFRLLDLSEKERTKLFVECANGINGEKIENLLEKSLQNPLELNSFLALFDFDGFDEKKLKPLNKYTLESLFDKTLQDFLSLEGFAEISAKEILQNLKENKEKILDYKKYFKFEQKIQSSNILNGKSFCFTGKSCKPRSELEKLVVENGGKVVGVSKNLSYLVTDDTDSGSSKNVKAKSLGIKVITSCQFLKLLDKN